MTNYYNKEGNVYKGLKSLVMKVVKDIVKNDKGEVQDDKTKNK